jgi:hypothetical protein
MATIVDGYESKWIYSADDQYCAVASGEIKGDWDEVMANAHLIAAAPEMFEELKLIVDTYDKQNVKSICIYEKDIDLIRTILAKAEGGE